jgi:hypothetical protein
VHHGAIIGDIAQGFIRRRLEARLAVPLTSIATCVLAVVSG